MKQSDLLILQILNLVTHKTIQEKYFYAKGLNELSTEALINIKNQLRNG